MLTTIESRVQVATLVQAAQRGDRLAFATLYQEYGAIIHGIVLAHVSYQDAEDLVQEIFMKALKQLSTLREAAAFPSWLVAIARRTATDFLRSRRIPAYNTTLASEAAAGPNGDAFAILAVIRGMPESYRETLILRLVEGMTGPEIAARTGLTPGSVRVNLCRGMKLLRKQLEGSGKL